MNQEWNLMKQWLPESHIRRLQGLTEQERKLSWGLVESRCLMWSVLIDELICNALRFGFCSGDLQSRQSRSGRWDQASRLCVQRWSLGGRPRQRCRLWSNTPSSNQPKLCESAVCWDHCTGLRWLHPSHHGSRTECRPSPCHCSNHMQRSNRRNKFPASPCKPAVHSHGRWTLAQSNAHHNGRGTGSSVLDLEETLALGLASSSSMGNPLILHSHFELRWMQGKWEACRSTVLSHHRVLPPLRSAIGSCVLQDCKPCNNNWTPRWHTIHLERTLPCHWLCSHPSGPRWKVPPCTLTWHHSPSIPEDNLSWSASPKVPHGVQTRPQASTHFPCQYPSALVPPWLRSSKALVAVRSTSKLTYTFTAYALGQNSGHNKISKHLRCEGTVYI